MAYTSGHIHGTAQGRRELFHSGLEWMANQINQYRYRRQLARAEAELRGFSDELLSDIGLSRGEIHDAVWHGRHITRRQGK